MKNHFKCYVLFWSRALIKNKKKCLTFFQLSLRNFGVVSIEKGSKNESLGLRGNCVGFFYKRKYLSFLIFKNEISIIYNIQLILIKRVSVTS